MKRTCNTSKGRQPEAAPGLILMCIVNHAIWSTHHVLARYLQVQANPPMDGMLVLCTGKFVSIVMTYYWGDYVSSWSQYKIKEEKEAVEDDGKGNERIRSAADLTKANITTSQSSTSKKVTSFSNIVAQGQSETHSPLLSSSDSSLDSYSDSEPTLFLGRWSKTHVLIINAILTTTRASLNVASAKYSKSYNLSLINSSVIFLVPLADRYFLRANLPQSLWYAVGCSIMGSILIALSHVPFMNGEDEVALKPTTTAVTTTTTTTTTTVDTYPNELYGCFLQFISCILIVAMRLLVRMTEGMISPTELVQSANIGTFILPAMYITVAHPSSWSLRGFYNMSSFMIWLALTFFIFFFAATAQVSLVQSMGPGLYSSFTAIRIVGAVALSSLLLHESIRNSLEGLGLMINIITMTIYLVSLYKDEWGVISNRLVKVQVQVHDESCGTDDDTSEDSSSLSLSSSRSELMMSLVKRKASIL